jgi:phosphoribosylaminoimidazolecarboxamide formyltransferase/IMP cyclohydrolase
MAKNLQETYKQIIGDHFPDNLEIKFGDQVLQYEKVGWEIEGELKGLRYGDNPDQEAAMYRLVNGNLTLGEVKTIQPGKWLASSVELLQSGKHPGKTNITDADNALNILRYFQDEPVVAILKHNNPCGVAIGETLVEAYKKANLADRVAAFGGAIALNNPVDEKTAQSIIENYAEVVLAPDFEEGVLDIFATKKNLRVMKIENMQRLKEWAGEKFLDFKSLIDGGLIVQTSFTPLARSFQDIKRLPLGYQESKGVKIDRKPTEQEYKDMWFGWLVEAGITSNSVIYVKDGVTVGIGTGEQDRVGVAKIARDKAYEKLMDRICFEKYGKPFNDLELTEGKDSEKIKELQEETAKLNGGLKGAVMVSDAFFPFRDGADVGLSEGITAIIQPGGSINDEQAIEACNEANATMIFTGQRSFKH